MKFSGHLKVEYRQSIAGLVIINPRSPYSVAWTIIISDKALFIDNTASRQRLPVYGRLMLSHYDRFSAGATGTVGRKRSDTLSQRDYPVYSDFKLA